MIITAYLKNKVLFFYLIFSSISVLATEIRFETIPSVEALPKETTWAIAKDKNGMLWYGNDSGLLKYDGYKIQSIRKSTSLENITNVRKLLNHRSGDLWVGTQNNGLYRIIDNKVIPFTSSNKIIAPNKVTDIIQAQNGLWVGSHTNLVFITEDDNVINYPLPNAKSLVDKVTITAIVDLSEQELLITTQYNVFIFDKSSYKFSEIDIYGLEDTFINTAYQDTDKNIWIATDQGVFKRAKNTNEFKPYRTELINFRINTIIIDNKNIWFGSNTQGLIKISKQDASIVKYRSSTLNSSSISGDSITSMLLDDTGIMFIGSFHGWTSYFNTNNLNFGFETSLLNSISCIESPVFYGIDVDINGVLWISAASGMIEYNLKDEKCINHNIDTNNHKIFPLNYPLFSFSDAQNKRWVTSSKGIYKLDKSSGLLDDSYQQYNDSAIYTMIEINPSEYLLGSRNGLYKFKDDRVKRITSTNKSLNKADVRNIIKVKLNELLLATDAGVASLDSEGLYKIDSKIQSQLPTENIYSIFRNHNDELWVGTSKKGIFKFDKNDKLITRYDEKNGIPTSLTIFSILHEGDDLWLGTDNGLARLNINTDQVHMYRQSDGLQGNFFIRSSAHKSDDGKLYFGGRNGLNAFYPKDIKLNKIPPNIVLTNLTRFGKTVESGIEKDGFVIDKPINDLDELVLTHKDYVIGFEFAALDFADPSRNKYAFMMQGLDPDWNYVNADERKISYSNLAAGDYVFRVKGSNKDGTWNETGKSLKVTVLPAPWLTWWAYSLYVLTFFALLFGYLYRKNQANRQVTKMLRYEVDKQTKALQVQKQKVETLLKRKNELFANVSHEFRTPLTLILGPINKLLKSQLAMDDIRSLQMVNRNANRLLTMIEQLLQLAKMSNQEEIVFVPQQVHPNIETLVASFQPLAETKNISLKLLQNDDAAISATQDVIDIVLGNLISNALKYTQDGGAVTVSSIKQDNYVTIAVTDNGCGLDEQQQINIFNRFTRLDSHLDIAGVGIGLSVVEEMLKVNNGTIQLTSALGEGSTFAVRFHCVELTSETQNVASNKSLVDQLVKESYTEELDSSEHIQFYGSKSNECILIIDDNLDMRTHVAETLKHQYYCITADRGKAGIAQAIKFVPDIVICDVMMPGMDGFQVSRILRSDTRTSHIPLILLTALNDKKSRIKGWRENIDVYLTKPFDADELLIQLENILVIRNILKKKAGAAIKAGKMSVNSGLPKNDQVFVDKFIQLIAKMYTDPNFLRPQMASLMAVSDRQLQRKMKALIDKNPMDMLREHRLKQAAESLKDGYQVSITADNCGFNSVTYFSKCFKEQYGVSPKIYQQTCNDRTG